MASLHIDTDPSFHTLTVAAPMAIFVIERRIDKDPSTAGAKYLAHIHERLSNQFKEHKQTGKSTHVSTDSLNAALQTAELLDK